MGADPQEQQLLADVADLISCIIEAAPFRATDQEPDFKVKQLRGPREKSLAARHLATRAFQKALYGSPQCPPCIEAFAESAMFSSVLTSMAQWCIQTKDHTGIISFGAGMEPCVEASHV